MWLLRSTARFTLVTHEERCVSGFELPGELLELRFELR
jgi:hypothetical protein